jgi:hypothetical protein
LSAQANKIRFLITNAGEFDHEMVAGDRMGFVRANPTVGNAAKITGGQLAALPRPGRPKAENSLLAVSSPGG